MCIRRGKPAGMSFLSDIYASRKPLCGFCAIGLAWASYFAQIPVVKGHVGASDGAYGMAVLWASLGAVGAMWLAPMAQQITGRFAVPLAIVAIALGLLGAGMVPALWLLAVMLLVLSAGSGVVDVLINADVAETEARTGRIVGALRGAGWSPQAVFAALLVPFALLAWGSFGTASQAAQEEAEDVAPSALPTALIWTAGALVFFGFLAEAAAEGWSALLIERELNGSPQQGAMGPALLGLMMGVGRLSGHALARFVPETRLMVLACLVASAGLVGAALAPTAVVALGFFAVAGLGVSVVAPLTLALAGRAVPARLRLAVISRVSVLGYGAFFIGPPLMGVVAQGLSLSTAFACVGVLIACVGVTLVPYLGRMDRARA